jgi:hypothetical protein
LKTEEKSISADAHLISIANANVRRIQIGGWVALMAIAAARAWFTRYQLEPDSMSYLDIARTMAEGHPGAAIHAYWSSGYPVILSLLFRAFHPNAYWEFPLVHLVNLLIFIGTLAAFQIFWNEVLRWHRQFAEVPDSEIPEDAFWALGYAVYGIAILNVITVGLVGPDLLVSAFCCLAGWSALRLRRLPSFSRSVLFGCILALAYYAKAPFFPMGFVFIVCAYLGRPVSRRPILMAGTATVTFLLICAPFITVLSVAKGRLTFGDSARVNEAFYIDGVQAFRHWQGGPTGSGIATNPTHKLNDFPEIYEFAADKMGTYPPWFDPTYWNAGITPHFVLKRQAVVLVRNLALEFQIIMESGAELVCVVIILALLCKGYPRRWVQRLWPLWFIWVPGALALAMFALVHVEPRFLGGWLILLFAGATCACSPPPDHGTRRAVWCIAAAVLITTGASLILQTSREAIGIDHADGRNSEEASIALQLLKGGLHPGDHVALIGDGTGAYWAHLARLQIVAEIPAGSASRPGHPALDFWESGSDLQQKALNILEETGARAVIAGANPSAEGSVPSMVPAPWKRIDGTPGYIYFFPAKH